MVAADRGGGHGSPCSTAPSPLPEESEAPSETFEKLRGDLTKFWVEVRSDLNAQLHRQERVVLERLERLECSLQHGGLYSSGAACSKDVGYIRGSSSRLREGVSGLQIAQGMPSSRSVDSGVSREILQEIGEHSQRSQFQAARQPSGLSDMAGPRTSRALQVAKTISGRRFPPLKTKDSVIARIARSWELSLVVALVICVNAFTIGMSANFFVGEAFATCLDRPSNALGLEVPEWTNILFACFFAFECLLRIYAERSNFIFGAQWRWNVFDLFLVISNIVEAVAETTILSYVRTLRIFRTVHVLQVIRVLRVFDVLRHMVYAILNSILSIGWIVVVLGLMLYVYGTFLVSIVGHYVQNLPKDFQQTSANLQNLEQLDKFFGTLSRSMLVLFEGVTGGINWIEIIDQLIIIHWIHGLTFLAFVIFIVFGVLNIVTGIFVERATELTKLDKEMTIMNHLDEMQGFVQELRSFFTQADSDNSGTISWDEFRDQLNDTKVRAYFQTMGIDAQSAIRVFSMLDRNGDGHVELKEFVEGCIRLKGTAKSIDVCVLLQDVRRVNHMLQVLMQYTEDELGVLRSMMSTGWAPRTSTSIGHRLTNLTMENTANEEVLPPVPEESMIGSVETRVL